VRFRDGDPDAFHEIVAAYQARLVQFYYRLCWDRDRAEDFAQELFMKLLRGARSYRPEGKLSTFIFRVATNLWIDHYRASRPLPRLYSLDQPLHESAAVVASAVAPGDDPADRAIDREERARLQRALESLTEPHRLVFELAVYQQLPYADIGEVLQIPVGTVKSRMHNSVRALRELLASDATMRATGTGADDELPRGGALA
jgi:RNA polymerase sigma-70 factor (ECF subfamily)